MYEFYATTESCVLILKILWVNLVIFDIFPVENTKNCCTKSLHLIFLHATELHFSPKVELNHPYAIQLLQILKKSTTQKSPMNAGYYFWKLMNLFNKKLYN